MLLINLFRNVSNSSRHYTGKAIAEYPKGEPVNDQDPLPEIYEGYFEEGV